MALDGKSLMKDAVAFLRNPKGEIALLRMMKAVNQQEHESVALTVFDMHKDRIPFDAMPEIIYAALHRHMDTVAATVIAFAAPWTIEDKGDDLMQAAVRENAPKAVQALIQRRVAPIAPPAPPPAKTEKNPDPEKAAAEKSAELHALAKEATQLSRDLKIGRNPIQFKKNRHTPS